MTMPYDGRSRPVPAPASGPGALAPDQFRDQFVEELMSAWLVHVPQGGVPAGLSAEDARLFHATYLKYFSFFAWRFPSWLMAVACQCPYLEIRKEILEDCTDEEVGDPEAGGRCHIDVLYDEAEACGISREEIYDTEPTPPIL